MRRFLWWIIFALTLAAPTAAGAGDDSAGSSDEPDLNLAIGDAGVETSPLDLLYPTTTVWGAFGRRWTRGDHELTVSGASFTEWDPFYVGGTLPSDAFVTSIQYRYRGILGGAIRPVARFTTGVGRGYADPGVNTSGFHDGDYAFAMPEAGVELVYKGYGVGMTAGYFWYASNWSQDDELNPYSGTPYPGSFDWDQLIKNIYLVAE